ncbi:DNase I-like protein [Pholiota conissans]|uniref:DNase I-like protein n=1 Tax=Pholiota conissans TaxID=109636 RepID=A0A9P5ZDM8_9AGAR|nr:DNase I-like protein [Pholiota conissans]
MSNRVWRTLSAFNPSTRLWTPASPRNAQNRCTQKLSLTSWNIDGFSPRAVSRSKLILGHILADAPDIIFLQEVTRDVRASLLGDERVRRAFLTTDAEDQTSFAQVPFATMTLLSRDRFACNQDLQQGDEEKFMFRRVFRMSLPSKYRRDALCVDVTAQDTMFRLINVHFDSLGDTLQYRAQQMHILADLLREPGCGGGIIAGDFNAISPEDAALIDKNGLVDAWVALHGATNGATWSVGVERRDGLRSRRLDKVAMLGLKAEEMEILRPGRIKVPTPGDKFLEIPWSDHCGLRCTFTV